MLDIPEEDKKILLDLAEARNISNKLILGLVSKAMDVRYQDKAIGFKDEISDLIKRICK